MSKQPKFSSQIGENIELLESATKARWSPKHSGGWAYCERPIGPGETYLVRVRGSGHYDIRFICKDQKDNRTLSTAKKPLLKQLNEVKIHKKECLIPVTLSQSGKELSSTYNDTSFTEQVDKRHHVWIAVYVKFGEMSATMFKGASESPLKFSTHHGVNIGLEENNTKAASIKKNPASICYLKKAITSGEQLVFQCSPIIEEERAPSRYHVQLQVHHANPDGLKKEYGHLFKTNVSPSQGSPFTAESLYLEKEDYNGEISVTMIGDSIVEYGKPNGKRKNISLSTNTKTGVWLIFDMYRTEVCLLRKDKNDIVPPKPFTDVLDGRIPEPRNEFAENTMSFIHEKEHTYVEINQDTSSYTPLERIEQLEREKPKCEETLRKLLYFEPSTASNITIPAPNVSHSSGHRDTNIDPSAASEEERLSRLENEIRQMEQNFQGAQNNNGIMTNGYVANMDVHPSDTANRNGTIPSRLDTLEKTLNLFKKEIEMMRLARQQIDHAGRQQIDHAGKLTPVKANVIDNDPIVCGRKHYVDLISELDHVSASDYLYQAGIITTNEMKTVQNRNLTQREANKKLLDIMRMKRIRKSQLAPILEKIGQPHLVLTLFPNS